MLLRYHLITNFKLFSMSTLDNPNERVAESSVSFWPSAVRIGIVGGLIMIIYGLVGIFTGLASPAKGLGALMLNFLIVIVLYVGITVYGVRTHRNEELGGYISFGRAFLTGLVVIVIAGIISAIFTYVYMAFIDPDYMAKMVDDMRVMYERLGMDEDQIDQAMSQLEGRMSPSSNLTSSLIFSGVIGAIVSLIVGAIMKRNPPEAV